MKVLFAAAEGNPFVKTGGLADVAGALPKALRKEGADVRIVLPKYGTIAQSYKDKMKLVAEIRVPVGWRMKYAGIWELKQDGVPVYFIDNEDYFKRDGIYGYFDDGERFAYFSRAVLEILPHIGFRPDIVHTHDWHTAVTAALLEKHYRHNPFYRDIGTVFTVHNLQFQGHYGYEVLPDLLGLDHDHFASGQVEYHGGVNFLKTGLVFNDRVTTVSPTYADEIRTPAYGEGLDGELRFLGSKLSGIVNGIDDKSYNPATDPHIPVNYKNDLDKKRLNKAELQRALGLPEKPDVPLIGMVSRITVQKGFDLVADGLYGLLEHNDVQLVILGAGDRYYEELLAGQAQRYPEQLSVQLKFDEGLARRIYAGVDMFLMPSRFEPCGISQLISLRYGTVPIVRETGGLKDTVLSYNEFTGEGNGFTFGPYSTHDMLFTIRRALNFYRMPDIWKAIVRNAFAGDYSWGRSARQYLELYEEIAVRRKEAPSADGSAEPTAEEMVESAIKAAASQTAAAEEPAGKKGRKKAKPEGGESGDVFIV